MQCDMGQYAVPMQIVAYLENALFIISKKGEVIGMDNFLESSKSYYRSQPQKKEEGLDIWLEKPSSKIPC